MDVKELTFFFFITRECVRGERAHFRTLKIPFFLRREHSLTQNGDLGEELLVHLSLSDGGSHEDPPVAVSVDAPQLDVGDCLDRGGARSAVNQGQLAEAASFADGQYLLAVDQDLHEGGGDDNVSLREA